MKSIVALITALIMSLAASVAFAQPAPPAPPAPPPVDPANVLTLELSNGGTVELLLRPDKAPHHVDRIRTLARRGFYNGIIFHRVIEGFMAQTGDPTGTGTGGSDLPDLKAEFNDLPHMRGVLSMARAESEDSANSQFFIMLAPNFQLDGKYTAFGRVISGMQFVDTIARGEPPASPTRIVRASMPEAPLAAADSVTTPQPVVAPAAPAPADAATTPVATAPAAPADAPAPAETPATPK